MVHDDDAGRPIHLSLTMPGLQALARSAKQAPPAEAQQLIVAVAEAARGRSGDGLINPYQLHHDVHAVFEDVTIGQVASVLLAWIQVAR
jgi:hypothetical protein